MGKRKNKGYSKELKLEAIKEYLAGKGSYESISKKYGILSNTQLKEWVKMYNGHKEIKGRRSSGMERIMTKGRKTTYEERIEIVGHCIEHQKEYALTAEKYGVSYNQVYSWVQKYEKNGAAGLQDGRGRRKEESEKSDTEKLKAENKLLQARLKDKEMELELLKKMRRWKGGVR